MDARSRVIELSWGLPGVELEEGQHVGFSVRRRRFAWLLDDHHGDGRLVLTGRAAPGENAALARRQPERFFLPSYTASRGWVGIWLDTGDVDWGAVERVLVEAYLMSAPKRLAAQLSGPLS